MRAFSCPSRLATLFCVWLMAESFGHSGRRRLRRGLCELHPDIDPSRFHSRSRSMNEAFEDTRVSGWEPLVEGLELPDPHDRHVLAAAVRGRADVIVTENVRTSPRLRSRRSDWKQCASTISYCRNSISARPRPCSSLEVRRARWADHRSRKINCWNGSPAAGHLDSLMRSRPCWLPRQLRRGTSKKLVRS